MSDRMQKQAMQKFYSYMRAFSYPYKDSYASMNPFYPPEMGSQALNKDADKQKKSGANQYMPYNYPVYNPYSMSYPHPSYSMEGGPQPNRLPTESKNKMDISYPPNNPYSPYYPYYYPYGMYSSFYANQRESSLQKKDEHKQVQHRHHNVEPPQLKILSKPAQKAPLVKQQIVISSDSQQNPMQKKNSNNERQINQLISKNVLPEKDSKPIPEKKPNNMQVIIEEQADAFYIRKKPKSQRQEEKAFKLQKEKKDKLLKQRQKALKAQKEKALKYPKLIQKIILQDDDKPTQKKQEENRFDKLPKTKSILKANSKSLSQLYKERYNSLPNQAYMELLKRQSRQQIQLFHKRQKERQLEQPHDKQKPAENQFKKLFEPKRNPKPIINEAQVEDLVRKPEQPLKKQERQWQKKQQREGRKEQKRPPLFIEQKQAKKERIRDDHPLKQLRYNQSHGKIRLGIYFQSNIPNLMRNQDLCMRRLEIQKRLRERQVSAVTF